jgi:predicted NUDIX family NTP pyrophosphohydrolase
MRIKTTLNFDEQLWRRAKQAATEEGTTVTRFLERALAAELDQPARAGTFKLDWRTRRGRVRPGVDLADRDALYDRMEGRS